MPAIVISAYSVIPCRFLPFGPCIQRKLDINGRTVNWRSEKLDCLFQQKKSFTFALEDGFAYSFSNLIAEFCLFLRSHNTHFFHLFSIETRSSISILSVPQCSFWSFLFPRTMTVNSHKRKLIEYEKLHRACNARLKVSLWTKMYSCQVLRVFNQVAVKLTVKKLNLTTRE